MAGVWVFNNGVYRLENSLRRRVLVHLPSGEVVSSYSSLEHILRGLGWERYYGGDPDLYQFHKHSSIDLISLPKDFSKFCSVHILQLRFAPTVVLSVRQDRLKSVDPNDSENDDLSEFCLFKHKGPINSSLCLLYQTRPNRRCK
ncbi:hypothetical protein V6Z12_D05G070300 [Gossypium hirsutum]